MSSQPQCSKYVASYLKKTHRKLIRSFIKHKCKLQKIVFAYLAGKDMSRYLVDMKVCKAFCSKQFNVAIKFNKSHSQIGI